MTTVIRKILFGPPSPIDIEAMDADKPKWKGITNSSAVSDMATGLLNAAIVVGSGTQFRGKLLLGGLTALCFGVAANSNRFRLEATIDPLPEEKKDHRRFFWHTVTTGLETARNCFLGACSVLAIEKKFGGGLTEFVKVGVDQLCPMEGVLGNVIPTLAIGACGFSLAFLLDKNSPEVSRVLRVMSAAHAVYGLSPENVGTLAEMIVTTNSGIITSNGAAAGLLIGIPLISYLSADDRRRPPYSAV